MASSSSSTLGANKDSSMHSTALRLMLDTLQEQETERRRLAGPIAASVLQAFAGRNNACERAQFTVHKALLQAKAFNAQNGAIDRRTTVHAVNSDGTRNGQKGMVTNVGFSELQTGDNVGIFALHVAALKDRHRRRKRQNGDKQEAVHFPSFETKDVYPRPGSKSDHLRADLQATAFQATTNHREPGWAAVELLHLVGQALNPTRTTERASQAVLNAIRVLPGPVAGDLFVICAARGDISVILFYFHEGWPIDHAHTNLKYQALHAAAEFGHLDSARLLVTMGAKVDARGGMDDRSPLFLAALAKRWDVCAWLLEVGASKILRDRRGLTAYQAVAGSSDPEVTERAGMLTDPPQRVVSVTCRGISHNSLTILWSEPLRSYDDETFTGYMVEWRPMRARPIHAAYSRHLAERERPPKEGKKKRGRQGWADAAHRPGTAGEASSVRDTGTSTGVHGSDFLADPPKRPNTGGGETVVDADGIGEEQPWKGRGVETCPLLIKGLYPATNYMVRVSARTLAGYGPPSREALLRTRVSPSSAPPRAPVMVSATPSSVTIRWIPPKYENGEPIRRYEIQRLVLDKNHPDWDVGQGSSGSVGGESSNGDTGATSLTNSGTNTTRTDTSTTISTGDEVNSIGADSGSVITGGEPMSLTSMIADISSDKNKPEIFGSASAPTPLSGSSKSAPVLLDPIPSASGPGAKLSAETEGEGSGAEIEAGAVNIVGEDRKQIGVWVGQRTEKMIPYFTAGGLPTYCRAKFRVRAGNAVGWGPFSPASDPLEAQDIIVPIKRGATHMLVRWFNKPEGDVLKWELSRRAFKYGADFRGDDDDSWLLCSRDIPGMSGGESTFRCKGLMPGTEYQFRLRAFSSGAWQPQAESIVSSPFRTVCAPPDPPPNCPTSRQLESDPVVPGGLVDTGAMLAAFSRNCGSRNGVCVGVNIESSDRVGVDDCDSGNGCRSTRGGRGMGGSEQDEDVVGNGSSCKKSQALCMVSDEAGVGGVRSTTDGDISAEGAEKDGKRVCVISNKTNSGEGRGGGDVVGDIFIGGSNGEKLEKRGECADFCNGRTESFCAAAGAGREPSRTGCDSPLLSNQEHGTWSSLAPLTTGGENDKSERQQQQEGEKAPDGKSGAGSTSIVLEWDAGCPNGAIVTNYEVWGLAEDAVEENPGEKGGRGVGQWRLAVTTDAAPTVTLSGLRQAQPYRFKVRARNALGWSDFGPTTPPLVLNPLPPCKPPALEDKGVTWLALRLRAPPGSGLLLGFELQMCSWAPGMCAGEEQWGPLVGGKGHDSEKGAAGGSTMIWTAREDRAVVWDLKPGARYRFKARAKTVFGWSPGGRPSEVYTTARRF